MPGDLWEMPWLTLTLSFPCRAESEAPHRPTSPKVSRSPPEAAAPAEETARRSELAVGGEGAEGGQGEGSTILYCPMFSDTQGRHGIQGAKGLGLLPDTLGSDSSSVTLDRRLHLSVPQLLPLCNGTITAPTMKLFR